jgi:Fe-S cluster assembly scaffold protein SufB
VSNEAPKERSWKPVEGSKNACPESYRTDIEGHERKLNRQNHFDHSDRVPQICCKAELTISVILHANIRAIVHDAHHPVITKKKVTYHLGANAQIEIIGTLNTSSSTDIKLVLAGPNAHATVYVAAPLADATICTIKTTQEHLAPSTYSNVLVKSALRDTARLDYQSLIVIAKEAHQAHATQRGVALTLTDNTHAIMSPNLEVLTDDVTCAHGAAVGKLDENLYFYLGSRGIERPEATDLMVEGFFQDGLPRVVS